MFGIPAAEPVLKDLVPATAVGRRPAQIENAASRLHEIGRIEQTNVPLGCLPKKNRLLTN